MKLHKIDVLPFCRFVKRFRKRRFKLSLKLRQLKNHIHNECGFSILSCAFMTYFLIKNIYSLLFVSALLVFLGIRTPLTASPLYVGGGIGYNGSYFNASYALPIGIGLSGAFAEIVKQFNAKEEEVNQEYRALGLAPPINLNPSFLEGGCPDTTVFISDIDPIERDELRIRLPDQSVTVNGRSCEVTYAARGGAGLGLNSLEMDITTTYDMGSWAFVRLGMIFGYVFPIHYTIGIRFTGDVVGVTPIIENIDGSAASEDSQAFRDIIDEIEQTGVGTTINSDSRVTVTYGGYHLQIPITFGTYLYKTEDFAFYLGLGITLSVASFRKKITGWDTTHTKTGDNPPEPLAPDTEYLDVVNEDNVPNPDILTQLLGINILVGIRRQLWEKLFWYFEIRFLTAGGTDVKTKGTQKDPDQVYASDTPAAAVLSTAFLDSIPEPLQNPNDLSGRRVSNGLDLRYSGRLYFGVVYRFDFAIF